MQNTENQHNISDTNCRYRKHLLNRFYPVPARKTDRDIPKIDQIIAA